MADRPVEAASHFLAAAARSCSLPAQHRLHEVWGWRVRRATCSLRVPRRPAGSKAYAVFRQRLAQELAAALGPFDVAVVMAEQPRGFEDGMPMPECGAWLSVTSDPDSMVLGISKGARRASTSETRHTLTQQCLMRRGGRFSHAVQLMLTLQLRQRLRVLRKTTKKEQVAESRRAKALRTALVKACASQLEWWWR